MKERADWTTGIRNRDSTTLEAVVHHCLPGLLRATRAAGLKDDHAEDAVQSAVLVFVRRAEEFDGRAQASTWLHGILARTIQEQRRSISKDEHREDIDDVMESRFDMNGSWVRPPRGPAEHLILGELKDAIDTCLDGLPDRQRQAFALREVEGFDTEEVCKILAVSVNNLGVLLYRARNRLRECLEKKGMEGSSDALV